MPNLTRTIAVGAVGNVIFPLENWRYKRPNFPARLDVAVIADISGTGTAAGVVSLGSGSDQLAEEDNIQNGTVITWPDSYLYGDVVAAGEEIDLRIRTTALGAADVYRVSVKLTPIQRR